jgi:hypothetical protein
VRLLREPLIHFLAIGGLIFLLGGIADKFTAFFDRVKVGLKF